jgi:NADH dehydrogenase FAD-containing subunit
VADFPEPSLGERERVVVIGGGLSGVEVATEIAERHPRLCVVLLARTILPGVSERGRAYAERVIADLGIERRAGEAVEIDAGGLVLRDGARLDAGLVVWAGGFAPRGPAVASELECDASGRLLVDASLQAVGHDRIWVCGDAAAPPPGLAFARMGCALAMPMGAHAADNVVRSIRGESPMAFRFGYAGQCISLGRRRALVQLVTPEDRPRDRFVSGRMGALVKELISTLVIGALRVERLFAGAYSWPRNVEAQQQNRSLPTSRVQASVGG